MKNLKYDPKNAYSIYKYSNLLINKTLRSFINDNQIKLDVNKRGELGILVERYFFGLETNNKSVADFKEAGLELKTTGVKKLRNGSYTPKERLVLGMIDYHAVTKESFSESHLLDKIKFMLLIFYLYEKDLPTIDQTFIKNILWRMSDKDFKIMKKDWETIVCKIRDGRAHELSESDTLYLSACTKSSTSKNRTSQPFSKNLAKPRAFAFKQSYLKTIFYGDFVEDYDSILDESSDLDLRKYVSSKLDRFIGRTFNSLYKEFGDSLNIKTKNIRQLLIYRMMGVRKKHIEEFEKAGILTKVVRLEKNGRLKESISFPSFRYKEIAEQDWDESDFKNVVESEFLFLIFQKVDDSEVFKGFRLWSMPYEDRLEAERVWVDTAKKISEDIVEYLGISQTTVAHVRPHGIDKDDKDLLPSGKYIGKKSFWLNAKYIEGQLRTRLD